MLFGVLTILCLSRSSCKRRLPRSPIGSPPEGFPLQFPQHLACGSARGASPKRFRRVGSEKPMSRAGFAMQRRRFSSPIRLHRHVELYGSSLLSEVRSFEQISPDKNGNCLCTTASFTVLPEPKASVWCANSPQRSRPSMMFLFIGSQVCRWLPEVDPGGWTVLRNLLALK